jgi:hypothetical protein
MTVALRRPHGAPSNSGSCRCIGSPHDQATEKANGCTDGSQFTARFLRQRCDGFQMFIDVELESRNRSAALLQAR